MSNQTDKPLDLTKVRIEVDDSPFEVEVKRFNLPATLFWTCPACGQENEKNYDHDYLSYPKGNVTFEAPLCCNASFVDAEEGETVCEHEVTVPLRLELKLTLVAT